MKENYFKSIKDKVKNALNFQDSDDEYIEDDEEYIDDENAEEEEDNSPKYNFAKPSAFASKQFDSYGSAQSDYEPPSKSNSNIFKMDNAKKSGKLKVTLFVLEDSDDARNVADCMIERNVVTICDMTRISINEERRVLDFLDGVKYVCNSRIEPISERMYLIVPEAAELSGDFFSQVEHPSFY